MLDRVFPSLHLPPVVKISKDGRFLVFSDNVIRDTETGLEWMTGLDEDTDYYKAEEWVKGLPEIEGWRMPTVDELQRIYQEGKGKSNIDPVFNDTVDWLWVWSGELLRNNFSARLFDFDDGYDGWSSRNYDDNRRVFAVRSGRRG